MSWYQHWFADALYMELYAHRDAAEARQAIDLFERVTGLRGISSNADTASLSASQDPLLLDPPQPEISRAIPSRRTTR